MVSRSPGLSVCALPPALVCHRARRRAHSRPLLVTLSISRLRPTQQHVSCGPGARMHKRHTATVCRSYQSESGEEIPQAVIEAEEKSASGRQLRMAAFGVFGGLAGLLTLTRVGMNIAGVTPPAEFLQPSALGELLDLIVVATAGLLWNQEISTKEANVQRIWAEVKRRKEAPANKQIVTKDDLRRQRKKAKKKSKARGFSKGAQPVKKSKGKEEPVPQPPPAEDRQQPAAGGLLGRAKSAIDAANNTGRIQALQLNDSLEQAGVLKPLSDKNGTDSSSISSSSDDSPTDK